MAAQPQNVIVTTGPVVGPCPTAMMCPHCQTNITTQMETSPSKKTHLIFLLLCCVGCCLCAPCVYCTDSCMAKKHTCPNCQKFVGIYDG